MVWWSHLNKMLKHLNKMLVGSESTHLRLMILYLALCQSVGLPLHVNLINLIVLKLKKQIPTPDLIWGKE